MSKGKPEYTFYDGPPFATGLPHYGHILAGTIKDTVTRYDGFKGDDSAHCGLNLRIEIYTELIKRNVIK